VSATLSGGGEVGRAEDADHPAAKCVNGWIDVEKVGGLITGGFEAMLPTAEGGGGGGGEATEGPAAAAAETKGSGAERRDIDLLSLDIDGIDLYLLQPILETVRCVLGSSSPCPLILHDVADVSSFR
jgi:hypothetical protein